MEYVLACAKRSELPPPDWAACCTAVSWSTLTETREVSSDQIWHSTRHGKVTLGRAVVVGAV